MGKRSTSLDVETGDSAVLGKEILEISRAGVSSKASKEKSHGCCLENWV